MANFQFDKNALKNLEKQVEQSIKKANDEANKAAVRESTPEKKAHAFARVLRKHGMENVDEAEIRRMFQG